MNLDYDKFLAKSRERAAEILAMRANGKSFPEIGKKFNISYQRVQQIFKAASKLTKGK